MEDCYGKSQNNTQDKELLIVAKVRSDLLGHHKKQLKLCERLEAIADSLPDKVDTQECLSVARGLFAIVWQAHRFEEDVLFAVLEGSDIESDTLPESLKRLQFEHWEDESYAQDICDSLTRFVIEPDTRNPESLSYMLRGFFEGVRRHIAFETEHLLPLLPQETFH
jgi:hemerythrin-like domain-containing protein